MRKNFDSETLKCDPKALEESKRLEENSLTNLLTGKQHIDCLFSFAFLNIKSLNKNLEHLEIDHLLLQEDLIFATETWVDLKHQKT